jgi:hypothetical protein
MARERGKDYDWEVLAERVLSVLPRHDHRLLLALEKPTRQRVVMLLAHGRYSDSGR